MRILKKAQSMLGYAMLIGVVAAVFIFMAPMLKRSLQGRLKSSADVFGQGRQYEPGVTIVRDEVTILE